ncbi:Inositol-1-monophosphatase [Ferriphaselus amnicola]|uniref:Inositol-1-monophosphatase n=1 Tax=Ferriphaselus amnicola TaxID=1188319 RepID=A0A2Z6GFX6_9PROT|nr:inositol monophosphatase family protein [Ferriphaselus amnicola]BBE52055.1 Inositol-1-monophosphatase [Ferriphaselus amnicola]
MTRTPTGMSATLKAVIAAVKLVASEEIMPRYKKVAHQRKSDGSLCTEADIASQEALTRKLQAILNVPVVGEEMDRAEQEAHWAQGLESGLWCIDPIDGTSNFVRGLPYFAVSVALIRNGRSVLGVVYDPVGEEAFAAELGKGAFLNGERLQSRATAHTLSAALANVDLKRLDTRLANQIATQPPFSSQRNFGACTLDWCYTAAGRFDAYLHGGQKLWDYAAGSLILQEAGGHAACLEHDEFAQGPVWQRSAIAALDAQLFDEWKAWIRAQH